MKNEGGRMNERGLRFKFPGSSLNDAELRSFPH